ncbi:cell wall-binding repeat-containing protein [Egibacter rhizosphaerae]|nr:cell wall-binding repeat-containing protein [Egibacter rhizosphaerae]
MPPATAGEVAAGTGRIAGSMLVRWAIASVVALAIAVGLVAPAAAERLAGGDRLETAIEVARDSYPADGSAGAVVLARADVFADALAGTPLAVDRAAPMLITSPQGLAEPVAAEIERALGDEASKTVYLLGGEAALSTEVEQQVRALDYQVERLEGATRFETAVAIAEEIGEVERYLMTTGRAFPDALAAGPAAAAADGAVLLTDDEDSAGPTDDVLDANPDTERVAIGGPAAQAHPEADAIVGATREHTAVEVAERFFDDPPAAGLARSGAFPDALTGGAHIGALTAHPGEGGGPMLLTPTNRLAGPVADYLCAGDVAETSVYGGTAAISERIEAAVDTAVEGAGCSGEDPADASLTDTSVLHPRGVGLAQAGMTLHEVEATTGTSLEVLEFETFGGHCYYAQPEGVSGFSLMVGASGDAPPQDPRDGVVWRATTSSIDGSSVATSAGVRPGDSRADVGDAYGAENLTEREHVYQPDGVYLDYRTDDGEHGLRFEIGGDGEVQMIHGGEGDAITAPEGCA